MKLLGLIILLSGWGIVVAAVLMLHDNALATFILAALAVEALGLMLVTRAHMPAEGDE